MNEVLSKIITNIEIYKIQVRFVRPVIEKVELFAIIKIIILPINFF